MAKGKGMRFEFKEEKGYWELEEKVRSIIKSIEDFDTQEIKVGK